MKVTVIVVCIFLAGLLLTGCKKAAFIDTFTNSEQNKMAENGDTVRVDYIGTTEDGKVFDTSIESVAKSNDLFNEARTYEPLEFTLGQGNMIPGFEKGVIGMKAGETKKVTIPASDAYGDPREDLIRELELTKFVEAGVTPTVGQVIDFGFGQAKVLEVGEETVKLDFNNPLAGKTLMFEITVQEIIPTTWTSGQNVVQDQVKEMDDSKNIDAEDTNVADEMPADAEKKDDTVQGFAPTENPQPGVAY